MPNLVLLVAADTQVLDHLEGALSGAGYLVATATTFEQAKVLLASLKPDLLIAEVRLGAFNGMHLAVRSRIDHPTLPVVITHSESDPVLENEARRHGATFIVRTTDSAVFISRVQEALEAHGQRRLSVRRWPRKRVAGTVDTELAAEPVRICNVSYGGFRLSFGRQPALPEVFQVTVPGTQVTVKARTVWTLRAPTADEHWCGAEVVDAGLPATSAWREFVDAS